MNPQSRLLEAFDTLPTMSISGQGFKPAVDLGSSEDLLRYMNSKSKENKSLYPLIWFQTPFPTTGDKVFDFKLKMVLSTLSNAEMSNRQRLDITFKTTLDPLLVNVKRLLTFSGFTRILDADKSIQTNFFKYNHEEGGNAATDIWDALKFECRIEMKDCPMRQVIY